MLSMRQGLKRNSVTGCGLKEMKSGEKYVVRGKTELVPFLFFIFSVGSVTHLVFPRLCFSFRALKLNIDKQVTCSRVHHIFSSIVTWFRR